MYAITMLTCNACLLFQFVQVSILIKINTYGMFTVHRYVHCWGVYQCEYYNGLVVY